MSKILLEIIALSAQDCVASEKGGADRIELCAAIEIGGVTPPFDVLIEARQRVNIPVMAMVRPRGGDFCYSDEEFAQMLRDAKLLLQQGVETESSSAFCGPTPKSIWNAAAKCSPLPAANRRFFTVRLTSSLIRFRHSIS